VSGTGPSAAIARGLTQEILGQVAKFKDIVIVEQAGTAVPADPRIRYILSGGVQLAQNRLRLQVRLTSVTDSSVIWSEAYEAEFDPEKVIDLEIDVARQVATAIGQPYGVIFNADSGRSRPDSTVDWTAYSCTLRYFAYRSTLDAKSHQDVRECLERAVADFPGYATAWALLAQTYIDEIRFGYPVTPSTKPASLDRVMATADRAVELDPQNVRALQSKMLALYFDRQLDAALAVGKRASEMNPNDTELMGEYGTRLADSGQWDSGCPLVAEALSRNPGPSGYYETILAICAYVGRDYDTAASLVRKAAMKDNPAYHLVAAAIFAEAGRKADAAAAISWLMTNAPGFAAGARSWAGLANVRPEDRNRFLASLRKAGLPVSP
jgi:TolB-like protein/Tfp pilus assembly protein PilF